MADANRVIAETEHLRLVERGSWSYVERTMSSGVVCVIACTTDDRIVLVEQFRPPVNRQVIELPAGLCGDLADQEDELLVAAAQRELLEETGYRAITMRNIANAASSAGITDEVVTFFAAGAIEKIDAGGGDDSEDITVHEIPLAAINGWLGQMQESGKLVDSRVYAGLYFLQRERQEEQNMTIQYFTGDATSPSAEGPRVIAHVCNDIGGWGRGFVVALSNKWPQAESEYRDWFERQTEPPFELGHVQFVEVESQLWVANMIGQRDVRRQGGIPPVRYEAVREALGRVADFALEHAASVHMPRIGCGLAGGDWTEVEQIIEESLCSRGITVMVYDLPDSK